MPTTAESWAADVQRVRGEIAVLAFPDAYRVVRPVKTGVDTRNNDLFTDTIVETGVCLLKPPTLRPRERVAADRVQATTYQDVLMPFATTLDAKDAIEIATALPASSGWRRFTVINVTRAEAAAVYAVASVEERG